MLHQQPRQRLRVSILILSSRSNRTEDLRPLVMATVRVARLARPGALILVGP
jgi:hypothetical protein